MWSDNRTGYLAIWTALLVPALWGLYWIPLRYLEDQMQGGAWSNVIVLLVACAALLPLAWLKRKHPGDINKRGLGSTVLGGAAFTMYSVGLLYGNVATVIVLFYMTPVWSILIAKLCFGLSISPWRYAAILFGLIGVFLVLNDGDNIGLPLPRTIGDWLGLLSGILWSVSSTGMNRHSRLNAVTSNFIFCIGALMMAFILSLMLSAPVQRVAATLDYRACILASLAIGIIWWALSLTALMWSVPRLDPARLGIFMMTEVIVGAVSAALYSDESYSLIMIIGTVLVVMAGFCEAYSAKIVR